jgi:hypothetical protein
MTFTGGMAHIYGLPLVAPSPLYITHKLYVN